jgi:hypothetical protein
MAASRSAMDGPSRRVRSVAAHLGAAPAASPPGADQSEAQQRMYAAGFSWCASEEKVAAAKGGGGRMNRPPWPAGLSHRSFVSPSMAEPVGYCIYLPPGYESSSPDWRSPRLNGGDRSYPVVYYLHGGRPGSELAGAGMAGPIAAAMEAGTVPPAIYVFVNGGPLSHYNYPHDTACVTRFWHAAATDRRWHQSLPPSSVCQRLRATPGRGRCHCRYRTYTHSNAPTVVLCYAALCCAAGLQLREHSKAGDGLRRLYQRADTSHRRHLPHDCRPQR